MINTSLSKTHFLLLSIFVSVILPMVLGLILSSYFFEWRWINYPFHSMIESVGTLSALTIATLMIVMVNNNSLPPRYILASCALISMGILDGFHAVLHAGISFVWLHSIATMAGGIIFSFIWVQESWFTAKRQRTLILSIIFVSIVISLLSITYPNHLPTMITQGEFSIPAKFLNISGGIGFIAGSVYFMHDQYKRKINSNEDFVFANHCFLFGIAGLLFESSTIWDGGGGTFYVY